MGALFSRETAPWELQWELLGALWCPNQSPFSLSGRLFTRLAAGLISSSSFSWRSPRYIKRASSRSASRTAAVALHVVASCGVRVERWSPTGCPSYTKHGQLAATVRRLCELPTSSKLVDSQSGLAHLIRGTKRPTSRVRMGDFFQRKRTFFSIQFARCGTFTMCKSKAPCGHGPSSSALLVSLARAWSQPGEETWVFVGV